MWLKLKYIKATTYKVSQIKRYHTVYFTVTVTNLDRCSDTAEIARVGDRYAVQGHSRSLMLVPTKSPYATSVVNNTNFHPILHCFPVLVKLSPPVNALVLGSLCQYRHKSYCWKINSLNYYIFVAGWSNFNQFDVVSFQILRIQCNSTKWRPLGRSTLFKVTDFGTNRKLVCNFLLVNNTDLHPILHRFQVIADYWSNFGFRQDVPVFNILVEGEPVNSKKHDIWRQETWNIAHPLYREVQNACRSLKPFRRVSRV